ncbi:MAG: CHAT domain-containing protein [Lewinellaceae bacterium]|nr:CHAT domain-containing protein [Saprospiraceae bacterium]MCB9330113.1 CHAT domain-containing protein [Lewinellaceae bacterium]
MKIVFAWWFCLLVLSLNGQDADSKPAWMMEVDSLLGISTKLTRQRQYDEALEQVKNARALAFQAAGRESSAYAFCQFNLGRIYYISGQYEQAEFFYLEAKALWEKVDRGRDYFRCLNNLAVLYKDLGRYEVSEMLYQQALQTLEAKLTKNDTDYPRILSNLAILYNRMGRFDAAEQLYLEIIAIREVDPGKTSREYAASLNNLAVLYYCEGRYDASEKLYLQAKNIREQTLGKNHQHYAGSLNNLALLYLEMGRYNDAEAYFLEAKSIWAATLGVEHPGYAECLHNLGVLYQKIGCFADAEASYLEAITIREKTLGRWHPDLALSLNKLGQLYALQGRYTEAAPLFQEASAISKSLLSNGTHFLSDRELDAYVQLFLTDLDHYYSFANQVNLTLPAIAADCYNNALFYKGFLLYAALQIKNLANADSTAMRQNDVLKSYRRRLAREYAKPIDQRQDVELLETSVNIAEKALVQQVAGLGDLVQQVPWDAVYARLKPGEAAVEFVHFHYFNPEPTDSILYAALVLRYGDNKPKLIPLFEEKNLARMLPAGNDPDQIDAFYQTPTGLAAYALIWQPLDSLLKGCYRVYCSPSGLLHRLNLSALPANDHQIVADKRQVVLLGSTRQLVTRKTHPVDLAGKSAMLFGGIRYDKDDSGLEPEISGSERGNGLITDPALTSIFAATQGAPKAWKYLPATLMEVRQIADILNNNGLEYQLFTGNTAGEDVLKQIGRTSDIPVILHLATHGYFFPAPPESLKHSGVALDDQNLVFQASDQVMIRSGLILAGANTTWTTGRAPESGEDGILTAYEISQLNFSKTNLVALSACETGLGELAGYEGVYGLQRAFKIAGARYLLMSLWQVNDEKTGELMQEFYHQYLDKKLPIPDAFMAAQATLRKRYFGSPYVWAGFVLVE